MFYDRIVIWILLPPKEIDVPHSLWISIKQICIEKKIFAKQEDILQALLIDVTGFQEEMKLCWINSDEVEI